MSTADDDEDSSLRKVLQGHVVEVLKATGIFGIIPTPLVPLALGNDLTVDVQELGFVGGLPRTKLGGYLRTPSSSQAAGRIVVNAHRHFLSKREILAHEIGHMALHRNQPYAPAFEKEADIFGEELRFHGPLFDELCRGEPNCLKTAMDLSCDTAFATFLPETARRFARSAKGPVALMMLNCYKRSTIVVESCRTSEPFREIFSLQDTNLEAPDALPALSRFFGQERKTQIIHHEDIFIRTDQGAPRRLTACVKPLSARQLMVLLTPAEDHAVAGRGPVTRLTDYQRERRYKELQGQWRAERQLLDQFGDLPSIPFQRPLGFASRLVDLVPRR